VPQKRHVKGGSGYFCTNYNQMSAFNSFMKLFLPKDRVFYTLFEEVSVTVVEMSHLLKKLLNEPSFEIREQIFTQIEDLEHKNDDLTHKIFTELSRNFITPFDREDIHYLASSLDDIADYIFASAKKINFYRVDPMQGNFRKMGDLIGQGTENIKNAISELRNMKNMRQITDSLVRINSIENQADDEFDAAILNLFATESDAKEIIKKREIFTVMEIATDKCEDAANVIESIIVKYA
jgi:predicted phosphate transport protein (TIGR00153 family)